MHRITVGDTLTPLYVVLQQADEDGVLTAVNLTGKTVKFRLVDNRGTVKTAETTTGVTVTSAADGEVSYDFQTADVDTAGLYWGWFTVYSGSERDTFPADRGLCIDIAVAEP